MKNFSLPCRCRGFAFFVCALLALLVLSGCARSGTAPGDVPTPGPDPLPASIPTPAPTPEPELPAGRTVVVDGCELESGSLVEDGVEYVRLAEFAGALGLEPEVTEGELSFAWRKDSVRFSLDGQELICRGELYVPVEALCQAMAISLYADEERDCLYGTPGAGDWPLAEGYPVPVLMYHGVSDNGYDNPELFVRPKDMREQLRWLLENGYEPILFEDLWHVEDFEKPVLLTYDDGYGCLYTELFPLLQEFNVKATVFLVTYNISGWDRCLTWEEIREMQASGLVSFQSHTLSHPYLANLDRDEQEAELSLSKLVITRETGREPFVLAYPSGSANAVTYGLAPSYYRFGLLMSGPAYTTGDDPLKIYRTYIARSTDIDRFAGLLGD